ncbi:hypothetical protein [Chryseobacterium sp. MFBS3-17]|uniref:hypothetical protein n=1 Tax=Chryseobacterium sp. MFBS3-17 TaxID=2886689 RepID=UPI001D0E1E92|nr:hypothetical protein [Chryseobacterium sp. MFBS3-17]MCC2590569.1 hypothetical protein [Chryseobacterium sp. MFBS3-17]
MMRKIFLKFWHFLVLLSLFSCRTEELVSSELVQQRQEYFNRSLWKEDEVYIKKVKQVFDEYADQARMQSEYGDVYWDYATSLNTYNESYLIAPVLKSGKVAGYVEAKRIDDKVFFQFTTDDQKANKFFSTLIFAKKDQLQAAETPDLAAYNDEIQYAAQAYTPRVLECKTVIKTLYVGEAEGGGSGQGGEVIETYTETICKFVDGPTHQDECIGEYDAQGNCTGGGSGGGGGGYPYNPEEEELIDECAKAMQNINDLRFKQKFKELNTDANLNGTYENGVFERAAPAGNSLPSSFIPISNQACTTHLSLPANQNGIFGLLHVHNNVNCTNGYVNVKAPSPVDMHTFFHILMKQANQHKGSYSEAYSVIITSYGSFMLKYNSASWPSNVTGSDFLKWKNWYKDAFQILENENQMTKENVQKTFAQFLKEVVNVDGLDVYIITENSAAKLDYNTTTKQTVKIECP